MNDTKARMVIIRSVTPVGADLCYGWHLSGPGPARHGWGWVWPTGRTVFLGKGEQALETALTYRADEVRGHTDGRSTVYYYPNGCAVRSSYTFPSR
jgi:hypothetical protein